MHDMPEPKPRRTTARPSNDQLATAVQLAAEVFASQHWHWGIPGGSATHTPDVGEIARKIVSLVERCNRVNVGGSARISSGRLLVERHGPVSSVWLHLADLGLDELGGADDLIVA